MTILLLGATGGTGQEVLAKLLANDYQVSALVREPENLKIGSGYKNLTIIKGSIYETATYQEAINQCDFVISTLGTGLSLKSTKIYSEGGRHLLASMRKAGVKNLITITSASNDPADPRYNSFLMKYIMRPLFHGVFSDMQLWEKMLESSTDIDWICVRPTRLTDDKEKGEYRVDLNYCPEDGSEIGRKDLASFIIQQLSGPTYIHQKPAIAY